MTNYDYLRSLSPEEMANEIDHAGWCDSSCIERLDRDRSDQDIASWCVECKLKWLKSERED